MIENSKVDSKGTCFNCHKDIAACICDRPEEQRATNSASESGAEFLARANRFYGTQIGDVIDDKYEIIGLIGSGGMGKVFKAKHKRIDRFYAIKVLKDDLADDANYRGRFEQEAKAASRMEDAHLVAVYDYGMTRAGEPYIVMDFVNGRSLESMIRNNRPLDAKLATQVFIQICQGLEHAHAVGIIHRDLKPSNVMLTDSNAKAPVARVLDFGIAKLTDQGHTTSQSLTKTGDVFGSPQYMSPEQCMGKKADRRSDIYSLGCLMFEVLTGYPPFHAENPLATMFQHVNEQPPTFAKVGRDVEIPLALQKIVMQSLSKKPEDRYQTMAELQAALAATETQKSPAVTQVSKSESKQAIGIAIGITTIVIGALLAALYLSNGSSFDRTDQSAKNAAPTPVAPEETNLDQPPVVKSSAAAPIADSKDSSKAAKKPQAEQTTKTLPEKPSVAKNEETIPPKSSPALSASKAKTGQSPIKVASLTAPSGGASAAARYEQGLHFIRARNYGNAIASLTEAIKLNPDEVEYYRQRAFCYADSNKYQQALGDYDRIIEMDEKDIATYIRRANALIMLNRSQQALGDLEVASKLGGRKDVIAALKGRAYHELRQYTQACLYFRTAIWQGLKEYSNYEMLAEDLWALNKKTEALLTANKAREIDRSNPWSYVFCAKVYEASKDYKSAVSELQKAPATSEPYQTEKNSRLQRDLELSQQPAPSKTATNSQKRFQNVGHRLVKINPFLWERR